MKALFKNNTRRLAALLVALAFAVVLLWNPVLTVRAAVEEPDEGVATGQQDELPGTQDPTDESEERDEDDSTETGDGTDEATFVFDTQPTSPEEVAALVEGAPLEDDGAFAFFLDGLPRWELAIDEAWLPAGWAQALLTDETFGTGYWRLTPAAVAMGLPLPEDEPVPGTTVSDFGSLKAAVAAAPQGVPTVIGIDADIQYDPGATLSATDLDITLVAVNATESVTLTASGKEHFELNTGTQVASLRFVGVTLQGNNRSDGGINLFDAAIRVDGAVFANCRYGIHLTNGINDNSDATVAVYNSTFTGNAYSLFSTSPTTIDNCVFENNVGLEAPYNGFNNYSGGVRIDNWGQSGSSVTNSRFINNQGPYFHDVAGGDMGAAGALLHDSSQPLLVDNVTFANNSGARRGGAVSLYGSGAVTIRNSTFTGNRATDGSGGAIFKDGNGSLAISGGSFEGNESTDAGGAMYTSGGSLSVNGTSFATNKSTGSDGGVLYAQFMSRVHFDGVSATGNSANSGGVAKAWYVEDFTIKTSQLNNNTAAGRGGALMVEDGPLAVQAYSELNGNQAGDVGGAVAIWDGDFSLTASQMNGNTSGETGGGAHAINSRVIVNNSQASNNTATSHGGALYVENATALLSLSGSTLDGNRTLEGNGGAVYKKGHTIGINASAGTMSLSNNTAELGHGGAVYGEELYYLTLDGVALNDNWAYSRGGAILVHGASGKVNISNSSLARNDAYEGGALFAEYAEEINLTNNEVDDNCAENNGGALFLYDNGPVKIDGGSVSGNTAGQNGGGIYSPYYLHLTVNDAVFAGNGAEAGSGGAIHFWDEHSADEFSLAIAGGSEFYDNTAADSGGAIYVPYNMLARVTAGAQVEFYDNESGQGYFIDEGDEELHAGKILAQRFTAPFATAYNNHDIAYTAGRFVPDLMVTYNPNGGEGDIYNDELLASMAASYTVLGADNAKLGFEREGHEFLGWSTDDEAAVADPDYEPDRVVTVSGNVTLYAVWRAESYTITFDPDQPGLATWDVPVAYGQMVPTQTVPELPGYEFRGWFDGDGHRWVFTDGVDEDGQPVEADTMRAQNFTLTARYEAKVYTLTFKYNNGNTNDLVYNLNMGDGYSRPATPSRSGYTFAGWFEGNTEWTDTAGVMPARNVTYTARWTPNSTTSTPNPDPGPGPSSSSSSSSAPTPGSSSSPSSSGASSSVPQASSAPSAASEAPVSSQAPSSQLPAGDEVAKDGGRGEPGAEDYVQPNGTVSVFGFEMPAGGFASRGGWSFVNLMLACAMLLNAGIFGVRTLVRRRNTLNMRKDEFLGAGARVRDGAAILWTGLMLGTGVLPLAFLPVIDNLRFGVMMFSRWTPLYLALTVVHIAVSVMCGVRARRR